MALPSGRKPLTDADMVKLLQNIAGQLNNRDEVLSDELRQTANRLTELSYREKKEADIE
jgi:hypothetical protein